MPNFDLNKPAFFPHNRSPLHENGRSSLLKGDADNSRLGFECTLSVYTGQGMHDCMTLNLAVFWQDGKGTKEVFRLAMIAGMGQGFN